MKVSKPVIILCIALLLITGYIHFFTGKKKPKVPVSPTKQAQSRPAGQSAEPATAARSQTPSGQQTVQTSSNPVTTSSQTYPKPRFDKIKVGWDSDPFTQPIIKERWKKAAGSAVRLVAILDKGGDRVAIIDKDVVKKGDTIGNERVAEIGKDRVVLTHRGIKRTLILADPNIVTQEGAPAKEESPVKEKATERAK